MKRIDWRIFSIIPAGFVMFIIFGFSGQEGTQSAGISGMIAGWIFDFLKALGIQIADYRGAGIELLQYPVRKFAHMSEYAVLTASYFLPCAVYKVSGAKKHIIPMMAAICYAAMDEFHQRFVPERAGCVTDVLIDSIGIILMTFFLWILFSKKEKCVTLNNRSL